MIGGSFYFVEVIVNYVKRSSMSGRSQNFGSNNVVTSENRRMNEYTMTLTRNYTGPSSDPQVRNASSKTMLS
jgi:hypothetical protein